MASGTLGSSLKHLRDLFGAGTTVGLGDAELLRRYAASHDAPAFEALVARHGPMVAATCRSVLRDHHDVEEAFQAAFLVLARRAASIRTGEALGGWLHRVARRAAVQRSIEVRRRRAKESEAITVAIAEASRPELDFDVRSILHEEIDRLPDAERLAVVLCDLEGFTYEQAAGRLQCSAPTLYHRLAKGRRRLRDRLIRRGVTAGIAATALELATSPATAAMPTAWTRSAIAAATGGSAPASVSALAQSLIRSLLVTRLKVIGVAAVLAFGSLVSGGLFARGAAGNGQSAPPPAAPATTPIPPALADEPHSQPGTLTVEARDLRTDAPTPDVKLDLSIWTDSKTKTSATTDDFGRARFPLPAGVRNIDIGAESAGFVPVSIQWPRDEDRSRPPESFLFQMEKATTVSGRVVDPDGKPVAGATVVIGVAKHYPRSRQWVNLDDRSTRSDADGRWSFNGVPEQPDSVKLAAYDYRHLREWPASEAYQLEEFRPLAALRDGSATLRLPGGGTTIEGTVVAPDGRAVAGASVTIGTGRRFGNSIEPLQTDDRGRFTLGMTPGTTTTLIVQAAGFGPTLEPIRVGREPQRLAIRLQPPHTVSGRVVDPDGKPIPNAEVRVASWRGAEGVNRRIEVDADGRFAWKDAPADAIRLNASAAGYASGDEISIVPGKDAEIILKPPTTLKGTVVDAGTGKPISAFRLAFGAIWNPGERLIWQRGIDIDKDAKKAPGSFEHRLYGREHQYAVRVFADGYVPSDSGLFPRDGKSHAFTFRLERAEPIRGLIRNPDGSPAAEAVVNLVPAEQAETIDYLHLRDGEAENRERWPDERAKAGPDGRFSLPPQRGNFALVALSDAGYSIVQSRDIPGDGILRLRPWARVSGTATIDGRPLANVWLSSFNLEGSRQIIGEPRIDVRYDVKTDAEGRFELRRVMAGRLNLMRSVPNHVERRMWFVTMAALDVGPGRDYRLRIGESGRRLTGRLAIPATGAWMIRKASIEPRTSAGPVHPIGVEILDDGRVRAQDLPPGDYTLRVALHEPPPADACGWGRLIAAYERAFSVTGGTSEPAIDLGSIVPAERGGHAMEVGEAAPDFAVETVDGRKMTLSDFRGRFLLLDFWATWCAPCVAELPNLRSVHEAFGADARFAMVSLSLDEAPADLSAFLAVEKLSWPQARVGPDAEATAAYGATAIPLTFLIGPDGKVLAMGLRGEALKAAIVAALRDRGQDAVRPSR